KGLTSAVWPWHLPSRVPQRAAGALDSMRSPPVSRTHMKRALPLNALRAFEAAARHGRMTAAAAELHVTHGAVSRQVRHLEAVLGVRLFEGPKSRLTLTEAGRNLLPRLTAAFGEIEAAVDAVADRDEGPLDVSCTSTFAMRWLLPRLHRFNARHPAVA